MSKPHGVLIRAETINSEGEIRLCNNIVVTLEEKTINVRLDDDDRIAILDLDEIEEGIKILKRWARD